MDTKVVECEFVAAPSVELRFRWEMVPEGMCSLVVGELETIGDWGRDGSCQLGNVRAYTQGNFICFPN